MYIVVCGNKPVYGSYVCDIYKNNVLVASSSETLERSTSRVAAVRAAVFRCRTRRISWGKEAWDKFTNARGE